jgi:hypothetical protein
MAWIIQNSLFTVDRSGAKGSLAEPLSDFLRDGGGGAKIVGRKSRKMRLMKFAGLGYAVMSDIQLKFAYKRGPGLDAATRP